MSKVFASSDLIEEETVAHYRSELFYPARLGDVLNNRYQIISKLGYGTSSTVWLAQDKKRYAMLLSI